ncbi:Pyruvate/2-oxoglutarate dehydrogenase complex, dihydrolipoamide dehydrogenase (E3) component [Palleronia marisminoris]|uniref:Dihydrolipoyl dehydrogenase n=1 Tax=Palleronia marisminoris TaxID=315423 RepID=A0A1Y5TQA1_9RHOB|nr:FAD-containing oxidoreductase [Palleronia marisminoris]SFH48701.1 Pyruvate/2-oxoglutarate dehydrogenase complex, dihydrolipoamide dehydrogenase (E3) component [Palleronia marisminoris]SLN69507.1 Dihydrolipoyl dehydrogenase [Palleronia marisminoris]
MTGSFDAVIVGAGQAGPPLAGRLTAAGMTVALIERQRIGGTCVNFGCTPTKTLVASAHTAHVVRRGAEFGIDTAPPQIDMGRVRARMRSVVASSRDGLEAWLGGMESLTLLRGKARLTAPDTVEVDGETLTAPRIFLNVGARPAQPDMPGIKGMPYLTSTTILELDRVPKHLVIVGGSYIGLEFAQMYRRFGADVTVVERGPALIPREDPEVSQAIRGILQAEGIAVRLDADCIALAPSSEGVCVHVSCDEGVPEVHGTDVLLAVGRTPNTDDLGLDAAGLSADTRGFIPVNERLETAVPGIWALGDCNGRGAFTHTSWNDHEIVAANLLDGADRKVSDRVPGYALYIDPPLGRAGLTEAQARAAGHRVRTASRPMTRVGRAVEKGETQGLMKVVVDADTGTILGAAILGPGGDEAIHGVLDLMTAGVPAEGLAWAVPIHPTVSELLPTLIGDLI